jgi:hypothetical protein
LAGIQRSWSENTNLTTPRIHVTNLTPGSERQPYVMYTVNESHAHLITAEEICVIKADPDRPTTGTVKTLTVRARLRIRGWWTLGLSHVAEKFLLAGLALFTTLSCSQNTN